MKKTWWKESIVYEIYPRSFNDSDGDGIGDLKGIIEKLDYLKELGVNVLWLAPVYASPNDDNGYDISDYRAIMPEFGTMADFDRLLEEAHSRSLKIVMDLVVNHTSDEHAWFQESRSSRESGKRDYYIWRDPVDGHAPTNWGSAFGGSAWEWDEKTGQYYLHCFSKKQPDLNWDNPEVRREVYDMMRFWLDKGIDGFRMDVINMISKPPVFADGPAGAGQYCDAGYMVMNGHRLHEYLQEMNREVLSRYDIMTVGECGGTDPAAARLIAGTDRGELNMIFQFEHVNLDGGIADKWAHKPMDLPLLKANLCKWQQELHGNAWNSIYFNNHDQPRAVSRLGDNSPESAKAIATVLYLMEGTPYLYQGEELGMTNYPFKGIEDYHDIESVGAFRQLTGSGSREPEELLDAIAYKSRDNARTPMQWNGGAGAGFTEGTPWMPVNPNYTSVNAAAEEADPDSVLQYYRKLLRFRTKSPEKDLLVYGDFQLLLADDPAVFAYLRTEGKKAALVVGNLTAEERTIGFSAGSSHGIQEILTKLAGKLPALSSGSKKAFASDMTLEPWEAAVWIAG